MDVRASSPIAQVDPRFTRWRRIRVPLFGGILLVVLVVSGLALRSCVVARGIRNDLARATELASLDTVEGHVESLEILSRLWQAHPGHAAIRDRYAWGHVLAALRLGPVEPHVAAATAALGVPAEGETELAGAARAGLLLLGGDASAAEAAAGAAIERAPTCRECGLVYGLALATGHRGSDAVEVLDRARQGLPPLLPALAALAEVLRELERLPEARSALDVLSQAVPDHQGAKVQAVLLELDQAAGDPAAGTKLVPGLAERLAGVTVDDSHPRLAAYKRYAAGRLALLRGDPATAAAELAAAAAVLDRDETLATWRAVALRSAGRHAEAVEALRPFPDAAPTSLALVRVRAEILLDLHRTADAAVAVGLLVRNNAKGSSLEEGRRLLFSGEPDRAVALLSKAVAEGHAEALCDIAEAHLEAGRADEARTLLRDPSGPEAAKLCASGMASYISGSTKAARTRWANASKAGARCGTSLAGRLLVGTGADAELLATLAKALESREDLRDRVALARLKLRVEGGAAARAELDRVRALEPQGTLVLAELVEAYEELGLGEVAAELAAEGVERTKGHPRLVSLAARLARDAGRLDDAEALLADGLKARPRSDRLLHERAALLFARRRYQEAEEEANKALSPGPVFADAACLRSVIQERRGDRQESQVALNRAASRAATRSGAMEAAEARACLVDHFIRRGQTSYGKARANLFLLRRSRMLWPQTHYLAAQLAERENEREAAVQQYREALALDIAHRPSWQRLSALGLLTDDERATIERLWPGQPLGDE